MSKLQCQRNGCGKDYLESENTETSCQFHTGVPIFHEGLKGWTCCKKRVTDFQEFLNLPGCTWSTHSPEKQNNTPMETAPKSTTPIGAPSVSASGIEQYGHALSAAAKERKQQEQQKLAEQQSTAAPQKAISPPEFEAPVFKEDPDPVDAVIAVGTKCYHQGCNATYGDAKSRIDECVFHFGKPIFHEGSKGWSCCKRRVLEFDEMFKIEGCMTGVHKFVPSPAKVMMSVYVKNVDKQRTKIEIHNDRVVMHIVYNTEQTYDKTFALFETIVAEKSSYNVLSTKIELSLCKKDPTNWDKLEK